MPVSMELVLIEDDQEGDRLYVLVWEYDSAKNKTLYFKLLSLNDWLRGRYDNPEYIVQKSDLLLYARDSSGYISTSSRLKLSDDGEEFYDEYGRLFKRPRKDITLKDLHMRLIDLDILKKLGEEEVIRRIKKGERFPESPQ